MIRGSTKQILLPPRVDKTERNFGNVLPLYRDARNGRLTDSAKWERRPGFSQAFDTGSNRQIIGLIPEDNGYAVTDNGLVFDLGVDPPSQLTNALGIASRPMWTNLNGQVIICCGSTVKAINTATSALDILAGSPPNGKFIGMLDNYVLIAGHDPYEFRWCQVANSAVWPAQNYNDVLKDGDPLQMMLIYNRMIYFWKRYSLETWIDVGGDAIFSRTGTVNLIDKTRQQGNGVVGDSVVQANGTFYFLMDGLFHRLEGNNPKVISQPYRADIASLASLASCPGFDHRMEHCIVWTEPLSGRCYVYDYYYDLMSEDNTWTGGWQRIPANAYMELNRKAYIGDYGATGLVHEWSKDYAADNGQPIRVFRDFVIPARPDGRTMRFNKLRWRLERGTTSDPDTPPYVEFRTGVDGQSPLDSHHVSLGVLAEREPYMDITNMGIGLELQMQIIETASAPSLITDGWLTTEPMGR
jgi:hypothetical protein